MGRKHTIRALAAALLIGAAPAQADPFEDFGTVMKYGLPLAAAACAADQDRLADFALRGGLQVGIVLGLKRTVGAPLGTRPTGLGEGFPSGHAANSAIVHSPHARTIRSRARPYPFARAGRHRPSAG